MTHAAQIKVPATYMRGGTSKGVFFRLQDLPAAAQAPGAARDALLMRVIGSPDPYGKQTDGMGGAAANAHQQRSEEHTSELQSLMRISYAVICLKKKKN